MSLNLALSTALSGLLTSQRQLDVVSHNIANLNTPEFTRKVLNPESRVLAGAGVGVQGTEILRNVDEGMLRDVRRENAKLAFLNQSDTYYTRLQTLFGEVGANSSISHLMSSLSSAFDSMAADSASSTQHWGVVQSAESVVLSLNQMTTQIQDLRRQADSEMQIAVEDINRELANIADLNNKIALNSATSSGVADLQDKRDAAVDRLSQLMDISYFSRGNNMQSIFTSQGTVLVDNGASTLTHIAVSQYQPWLTVGDGTVTGITIGLEDITDEITSGKLKALIDMRDTTLPNLQAEIDRLAKQLQDQINQIHNRGVAYPNDRTSITGSRTFIDSSTQTITVSGGDVAIALFDSSGEQTARTTLDTIMQDAGEAPHGPWTIDEVATNLDDWLDTQLGDANYVSVSEDGKFTITIPPSEGRTIAFKDIDSTVFDTQLRGSATTALGVAGTLTFRDPESAIMGAAVTVVATDTLTTLRDKINAAVTGALAELVEDTSGNFFLRVTSSNGEPITLDDNAAKTALGLIPSGTNDAQDVSVAFDANGDATDDFTYQGFSNFFGLNDFFDDNTNNYIFESDLLDGSFTTSVATTIEFRDATGLLGGEVSIPSGSTLDEIAAQINAAAITHDSRSSTTFSGNGVLNVIHNGVSIGALDITGLTLAQIETQINLAANGFDDFGVVADVVQDGTQSFLRFYDENGDTLSFSGTAVGVGTGQLTFDTRQQVKANVINEGNGQRLQLLHRTSEEMVVTGTAIDEMSIREGAVGKAGIIGVRDDIQLSPSLISRGSVDFDEDSGRYVIAAGSNTIVQAMAEAMREDIDFRAAGAVGVTRSSFQTYAATIVSQNARDTEFNRTQLDYQSGLTDSLGFERSGLSGVNIDEEISNLILYQQSYSAAARVISTVNELLEVLVGIVQ